MPHIWAWLCRNPPHSAVLPRALLCSPLHNSFLPLPALHHPWPLPHPLTTLALSPFPALQVCDQAPDTVYGTIIQDKINSDLDMAQAVGRIVYTAQAIVENAADKVGQQRSGGRLGGGCGSNGRA